jgi:urease gamma subunit
VLTKEVAEAKAPALAAPPSDGRITGRILETMDASGYTYIRVGTPSGDVWTAVQQTQVKKGATISIDPQMVAENFESTTLKRTFDKLVLGVIAGAAAEKPVAVAADPQPMGTALQHMTSAANVTDVKVEKAAGGKTVAETWAGKSDLIDKEVVIRGKIVKFLPDIMGKNWLHIRDGSGSREQANDDITVTSDAVASVGDVVTVTGTLRVDKDFGAGYRYPVIIENAKLRKD